MRSSLNDTWPVLHDTFANNANSTLNYIELRINCGLQPNKYSYLSRAIMTFDLSIIPVGSTILNARYCIYGLAKQDDWNWQPILALYQSWPLLDNKVQVGDYNRTGSTIVSSAISYASFTPAQWMELVLTPFGLTLLVPGQTTRLAAKEAKYDGLNIAPAWRQNRLMMFRFYTVEQLTPDYRPYLEITYMPP
jgi:hypothetical protein